MINSRPADQASVTFGDATTIPEGHAGTAELQPGKWAALLWKTPWKVAMQGRFLKGSLLPEVIDMEPERELMAREGFFFSGKREEERIAERVVNVGSAMIQCVGEVMEAECTSCIKHLGPLVC
jgi:hypothetical protein